MRISDVLQAPISQADFAGIIGVSEATVSKLVSDGTLERGATASTWLLAYTKRLREIAAGRASMDGGGLDLVQERAALAREQREGQAIKNAIALREYAPIELLAKVLADACAAVVERFESLPARLRKEVPGLPPDTYETISAVIASARNEWVRAASASMLRPVDVADDGDDDQDEAAA